MALDGQLRAAIASLYSTASSQERHAADVWLRGFSSQEGAWQQLLALLGDPSAAQHELFFAATALRPACQRHRALIDPVTAGVAVQLLAQRYAAAVAVGAGHTANQLAAALTALAVRAPHWPEPELLPQLLGLLGGALAAAAADVADEQHQLAALHLLLALAEAACAKEISMHPARREALKASLAAAPQLLAAVQQALGPGGTQSTHVQTAALQLLQGWCALGRAPAGAEGAATLWQQVHRAALHPQFGSAAAEALAALYGCLAGSAGGGTCSGSSGSNGGSSSSSSSASGGEQDATGRHKLLCLLLGMLPGYVAALQQALSQSSSQQQQPHQAQLLFAALTILGAAANAAERHPWGAAAASQACTAGVPPPCAAEAVQLGADVALAALQFSQLEATLAALQYWDEQLERWAGSGPGPSSASPHRHALLARLCSGLLQRMALPPHLPASCITADARDLPDEVRLVRREAVDTFRAAAECLGVQHARQQLLQLAAEARAGGGSWQQRECTLYALVLLWSRQRDRGAEAAAEVRQAAEEVAAALHPSAPKLAGSALTLLGGMREELLLLLDDEPQLERQAGASSQPPVLERLLSLLLQLVQLAGSDEKLSRNAATCCYRLTGSHQLAAHLAARHPGFSDALCHCFAAAGGMQQRAQSGEDLSTPQLLLVSICQLAAAGAAAGGSPAAGLCTQQGSANVDLLRRLLTQPAAAAEAALAAAASAPPHEHEQRHSQLERAAVQMETIAVALEAVVAGPGGSAQPGEAGSGIAQHLPGVLSSLSPMLRAAAATAAAVQQRVGAAQHPPQEHSLLQAVCRLSAAVAATPAASMALELAQPFAAVPQHPCVLLLLAELATHSCQLSSGAVQLLQAAIGSSLQAAAAQHGTDSDWQLALLSLGSACLHHLPAAAAEPASLDALLTTAQHSMQSYHRDVCERVLQFSEALCCTGCGLQSAATSSPQAAAAAAAAQQHLRQRLDGGGLGAALVLGLLLAAAGNMPPYMMMPIADALHATWQQCGSNRFGAWLQQAALQRAPEDAPWRRWKQEAQAAALADLLSPQCAQDARRFKRLLKVFCGGKKKGQHVDQPAAGS